MFELFLVIITFFTGIVYLIDHVWWAKHRRGEMPKIVDYSRSFFPVLLLVLLLRSFLAEPFRIPTGSLEPTLLPGDFVLTNKFIYGIRLPVLHTKIIHMDEPEHGDIVVFRKPDEPNLDLIKRAIGLPGDKISYINKTLYINGIKQTQTDMGPATDYDEAGDPMPVEIYKENLLGLQHLIYLNPQILAQDFSITVPPNSYFMMGDNRDNSDDSRYWGFLPEPNIVGKAFLIWLSWNKQIHNFRWHRFGTMINHQPL